MLEGSSQAKENGALQEDQAVEDDIRSQLAPCILGHGFGLLKVFSRSRHLGKRVKKASLKRLMV